MEIKTAGEFIHSGEEAMIVREHLYQLRIWKPSLSNLPYSARTSGGAFSGSTS